MRIISVFNLHAFGRAHADADEQLRAWAADTEKAVWQSPHDVKARYGNASILGNNRLCFNIKGNDYRLIVAVGYRTQVVLIKWVGTHAEYSRIDAETAEMF
jgi:mRNA interferase HigB